MKDPVALAFILFLTGCWAFPDPGTTAVSPLPADPTAPAEPAALSEEMDVVNHFAILRKEFLTSEQRILSYIYSAKNIIRTMTSNGNGFLDEMHVYLNQLPNSTQQKRTRAKCHCDGGIRSPCPERCMNSCYAPGCGRIYDDCDLPSHCSYGTVRCYEGSDTVVLNQDASVCYDPTEPARCSEFKIDRSNLEQSYRQFSNLLTEPFKMQIRELEYKLEFIKESLYTTSALSNITFQLCNESNNIICFPEVTKMFNDKLKYFIEFGKNITRELISGQDQMERVEHNLHVLREGTLKQIIQTIKKYTCCLKAIDFEVEGVECKPVFKGITELKDITPKTTTPRPLYYFQSDSNE